MTQSSVAPFNFIAGETVEWTKYLNKYLPKNGWNLTYIFKNVENSFKVEGQVKDDYYLFNLTSEQTKQLKDGFYWWQATVTRDQLTYVIAQGSITIKPNLSLVDHYDGRSHVKKVLDALEATILGKASKDQLSYSISGRSLSRLNPTELLKWRDLYKAEYMQTIKQERLSQGLDNNNIIKIRFNSF